MCVAFPQYDAEALADMIEHSSDRVRARGLFLSAEYDMEDEVNELLEQRKLERQYELPTVEPDRIVPEREKVPV